MLHQGRRCSRQARPASLERRLKKGNIRLSFFSEDITDALISQTAPLVAGSTTLFSYVQNIDKVRSRGAEIVAEKDDVLIHGLSLSGSLTYVDSETQRDVAFPAAVGKQAPQLPKWRSTLVATYRPDQHWGFYTRRPLCRSGVRHDR